jgi:hypothetical protein
LLGSRQFTCHLVGRKWHPRHHRNQQIGILIAWDHHHRPQKIILCSLKVAITLTHKLLPIGIKDNLCTDKY